MKIGDKIILNGNEVTVTRKVYDQSIKKTVFYAGDIPLTGEEKTEEKKSVIIEKLEAVEEAIEQPAESDVLVGVQYGAGGTEFTGTATGGGGGFISIINE